MEDVKVGLLLRALRRRKGLRQLDVAIAARVSQPTISRAERGHLDRLSMSTLRRVFAAVDARLNLEVRWRGGASERLTDEDHSALVSAAARVLRGFGWTVLTEVTFSI
ncbi:MAG: helix-turn-helix domain-containing protein [Chloroflexi bacterium]|nr:helix-turn-helix domain-containing protein [Chloroflexota bacterium]